jgi:hypothetical protein
MLIPKTILWPFGDPKNFAYIFFTIITIISSILVTSNIDLYTKASKIILIIFISYLGVEYFLNDFDPFFLDNIIEGSSHNGITTVLIVLQSNFLLANFINRKAASSPFTLLFCILFCILSGGRGAIICSILLLVANIMMFFSCGVSNKKIIFCIFLTFLSYVFFDLYLEEIAEIFNNTKLASGIEDLPRMYIREDYFSRINFFSFFSGVDLRDTLTFYEYQGNPHNSFIRAHSYLTIFYLLSILALPIMMVWRRASFYNTLIIIFMFSIIFIRAYTEAFIFPSSMDLFFFSMCFILNKSNFKSKPILLNRG